jgi:hypothetical protein
VSVLIGKIEHTPRVEHDGVEEVADSLNHDWQNTSEIGTIQSAPFSRQGSDTDIRNAYGTMGEAMTATPTMMTHDTIQISQNRFHMAGHSLKKCESSTSLTVDDHCMLYPVK